MKEDLKSKFFIRKSILTNILYSSLGDRTTIQMLQMKRNEDKTQNIESRLYQQALLGSYPNFKLNSGDKTKLSYPLKGGLPPTTDGFKKENLEEIPSVALLSPACY